MSRAKGEACHALLVEHAFHFAYPYRHASIGMLFYGGIYRHIGTGAVMLRPVKFDAAGDPRSCQAYQCRFDDVIVIDEVALFYFVISHLHTATQFGQDHDFDILVFNEYGIVCLVRLLVRNGFNDGIRINYTAATLIHTFL